MILQDLQSQVLSKAFPERIPRTLTPLYETFFKQSLSELQLKVPQLRSSNVQVTAPGAVTWDCGIMTVPIPAGKVSRVWISLIPTAKDATGRALCSQVEYFGTGPERIRELRAAWNTWISNSEGDAPDVRQPTADAYYTIMDGVVALYPPVPDCWQVNVQWKGVNRSWSDTDDVSAFEDILVEEFSRLYTLWKSATYEGCDQNVIKVRLAEMRDKLNDVIYDYRQRETPDLMRGRYAESPACAIPSCGTVGGTCDDPAPPTCADAICGVENEGPGRYYGTGPGATDGGGFWDLPIPSFLSLLDVQPADYAGQRGKMVVVNNTEDFLIFKDVPTGGGASRFTGLIDAPDDYSGAKGKLVAVNSTDDGLVFVNPPVIPTLVKPDWDAVVGAADEILNKPETVLNFLGGVYPFHTVTVAYRSIGRAPKKGDCWQIISAPRLDPSWTGLRSVVRGEVIVFDGARWGRLSTLGQVIAFPRLSPSGDPNDGDDVGFPIEAGEGKLIVTDDAIWQYVASSNPSVPSGWRKKIDFAPASVKPDWTAAAGAADEILNKPEALNFKGVVDLTQPYPAGYVAKKNDFWISSTTGRAHDDWPDLKYGPIGTHRPPVNKGIIVVFDGRRWLRAGNQTPDWNAFPGTDNEILNKPTIPSSFLDLSDVEPNNYKTPPAALKFVRVNGTGTGLTFSDGPIPAFKDLTDTPGDYQQGKILVSTTTGLAWTDMAGADLSVVKLATTSTSKTTYNHVSGSHPVILTVLMRVWRTHTEQIAADGVTVEVVAMDQALLDLGVKAGDVFDAGQFMVYEVDLAAGNWDQAFKWGVRQNPKGGWDILFRRWMPVNGGGTQPGVAFPPLKEEPDITTSISHNTILQQCDFYAIVKTMDLPPHSDAPITSPPNSVQAIPIPPNHLNITFTGVPGRSYRILYTTSTAAPWIWKEFVTPVVATADASGGFNHTDAVVAGESRQYLAVLVPV